jgi:peptide/nickel transport system ATP-binding protein
MTLLEVRDLAIRYEPKAHTPVTVVEGISFKINEGDFVGLIGESGSGKTTLGMAILRLLEKPGRIIGGQILLNGEDITSMSQDALRVHRWREMSTVFQSSMNALNPVVRVAGQFRDAIEYHTKLRGDAVTKRIDELFDMVMIDPKFTQSFPHELSGGMKQRSTRPSSCSTSQPPAWTSWSSTRSWRRYGPCSGRRGSPSCSSAMTSAR